MMSQEWRDYFISPDTTYLPVYLYYPEVELRGKEAKSRTFMTLVLLFLEIKITCARINENPVDQVALTIEDLGFPVIAIDCKLAGPQVWLGFQVVVKKIDDLPGHWRFAGRRRGTHAVNGTPGGPPATGTASHHSTARTAAGLGPPYQ